MGKGSGGFLPLRADELVRGKPALESALPGSQHLPPLPPEAVAVAFQRPDVRAITGSHEPAEFFDAQLWAGTDLLLMSAGTFDGLDLPALAAAVVGPEARQKTVLITCWAGQPLLS